MNSRNSNACEACAGRGWLLMLNKGTEAYEVQRCDTCVSLQSDEDARRFVSRHPAALASALFELNEALIEAIRPVLQAPSPRPSALHRVLAMVSSSLKNATELEPQSNGREPAREPRRRNKTYRVGVREVHVRFYCAQAPDPESAKNMVRARSNGVVDLEQEEYSHELEPEAWSVEEDPKPQEEESIREVMLRIAEEALSHRASTDGYGAGEYDAAIDPEGYTVSILCALRHWTHKHGRDWSDELNRAQTLFEEDLTEAVE